MHDIDQEPNARQAWSASELEHLRTLIAARVPVREIADRLGRTEYAVRSKASQEHISLRPGDAEVVPRRPK